MSERDDIPRERRLSDAEARALVERAKARGWISVRTDEGAAPARFHGNMAYVPRRRGKVTADAAVASENLTENPPSGALTTI